MGLAPLVLYCAACESTCARAFMARVLGLEDVDHKLRHEIQTSLRVSDESVVLPSAHRSADTGAYKNIVFRLSATEPDLDAGLFSPNWFSGVSAVSVPSESVEELLKDAPKRTAALQKLRDAIPSELADSEIQVGPELDGDENDRDKSGWTAGFDSSACCVGLYSCAESRAPESVTGSLGMEREHKSFFLVCKAGGGVAAQTFHSRITASLKSGQSLDDCFREGGVPGVQALRRVSSAAQRNRVRILAMAADALGITHAIDTLSDSAACPSAPHRGCVPEIDVSYNSLRRVVDAQRSTWQYCSGCVDVAISQGLITSSNVASGFVGFSNELGSLKVSLKNDAFDAVPFSSLRLDTTRNLAMIAAEAHKKNPKQAHPDHEFVRERFIWKTKISGASIEPCALWGSHASSNFLSSWARELGCSHYKQLRMTPTLVCIAAMEPAKLRAAAKHAQIR